MLPSARHKNVGFSCYRILLDAHLTLSISVISLRDVVSFLCVCK